MDCADESDEKYCKIVMMDSNYVKEVPLPPSGPNKMLEVNVGVTFYSITNLDELTQSYDSRFLLHVAWKDFRLSYQNLNPEMMENIIDEDVAKELWIPPIIVSTSKTGNSPLTYDRSTTMVVQRQEEPKPSNSYLHETNVFRGTKNKLLYMKQFDMDQTCEFDLSLYPFDTQVCAINVTVTTIFQSKLQLNSHKERIQYAGSKHLNQFIVVKMVSKVLDNGKTISCEIVLKRLVNNHILAIFFPTICLIIIGTLTLFIDPKHFDATIMVSLTTMLVTFTLYQSISEDLPKTGGIKLIDIWLLVGLIVPFAVFLILVIIEVLPEDDLASTVVVIGQNGCMTRKEFGGMGIRQKFIKWSRICILSFSVVFIIGFLGGSFILYHSQ